MIHLIQSALAHVKAYISTLQLQRVVAVVLVGFLVLGASTGMERPNADMARGVDQVLQKENPDRPTTTGDWEREARETEGNTGERLKRIGEETKEAVKDWGKLYPDTAKRSGETLKDEVGTNDR
jgi:hypothetical protein